jgi:hypothetical protein
MHVSDSYFKQAGMVPAPVPEHSAEYYAQPTRLAPATDPVDQWEARLILEMRHEEYVARRALEELFESGAEFLSI